MSRSASIVRGLGIHDPVPRHAVLDGERPLAPQVDPLRLLSGAAMDLAASVPSFGAGTGLWALALVLIGVSRVFPLPVRVVGFLAAILFGITALQIFAGIPVTPTTAPLPCHAYPVRVATLAGWIYGLPRAAA